MGFLVSSFGVYPSSAVLRAENVSAFSMRQRALVHSYTSIKEEQVSELLFAAGGGVEDGGSTMIRRRAGRW